jgi:hypothetical protein
VHGDESEPPLAHVPRRVWNQRKVVREIRWFVPGPLPYVAVPNDVRFEARTDRYHLGSLSTRQALKRRGTGEIELKQRIRSAQPVTYHSLDAIAEAWRKVQLPAVPEALDPDDWGAVHKRVWQGSRYQLAELTVDDETWWTLAVRERRGSVRPVPDWLRSVLPLVEPEGCSSYPAWVLERARRPPGGRRHDRSAR